MLLLTWMMRKASFGGQGRGCKFFLERRLVRNGLVCASCGACGGAGWRAKQPEEAGGDCGVDFGCARGRARGPRCRSLCTVPGGGAVCGGGSTEAECGWGPVVEGVAGGKWRERCRTDCGVSAAWRSGRRGLRLVPGLTRNGNQGLGADPGRGIGDVRCDGRGQDNCDSRGVGRGPAAPSNAARGEVPPEA